jgi:3'-phosphoadenosine 5'-phosphosulfate sulfotransferase (PAPS reductase)/FAD synthetase
MEGGEVIDLIELGAGAAIAPPALGTRVAPTTVISVGGGQDSTALLYRIGLDPAFRAKYAPGHVLAIMADTGDEHDETRAHVKTLERFCLEHRIEWKFLTFADGYHSGPWAKGLEAFYREKKAIGSQAFPKTCTDNLKIQPIYRFLADYLAKWYGGAPLRKRSLYDYAARFGKIRMIVGIAAGEEKRVAKPENDRSKWMRECVERTYPLIAEGMDRAACQAYIASVGAKVPPPSNCFMCPFKSPIEILWTARHDRARFDRWTELEAAKLAANAHLDPAKNFGVYKTKTLPEVLAAAEAKYATWTDAELESYRMSHGHCVASAY